MVFAGKPFLRLSAAIDFSTRCFLMGQRFMQSVLVVDDHRHILDVVVMILKAFGFSAVDAADDVDSALVKLRGARYDLIISDWHMGTMTGLDLLTAVRSDPATKDTPFIIMTSDTAPQRIHEANMAGVSGFIYKPFKLEALLTTVMGTLAQVGPLEPLQTFGVDAPRTSTSPGNGSE